MIKKRERGFNVIVFVIVFAVFFLTIIISFYFTQKYKNKINDKKTTEVKKEEFIESTFEREPINTITENSILNNSKEASSTAKNLAKKPTYNLKLPKNSAPKKGQKQIIDIDKSINKNEIELIN